MLPSPPPAGGDVKADESTAALTIRRYEERLAKDPGSLVFAPLADAHRKAGRAREAIRLCRQGLERFPGYGTARLVLAKALLDDGEPEAALTEVKTLLSGNPGDAAAHRLAAELLRRAGRLEESLVHLRQAASLDPSDRESRVLVEVLEGAGKVAGTSGFARLLADDTFATMSFGAVCLEQGLADEGAQVFLRILRKEPGNVLAQAKLEDALRVKTQKRKGS
jgi:tetratricopeptide (TPR) repeat protein